MDNCDFIAQTERLCTAQGKRLTDNRRLVLQALADSDGAMSAYEIIDAIRPQLPGVKPPTVYRALEFLQALGVVHQVESRSRYILCSHLDHQHRAQILVCDHCGAIEELAMSQELLDALSRSAAVIGFKLTRRSFEMHGLCQRCQIAA